MTPQQAQHQIVLNNFAPLHKQMIDHYTKKYPDQIAATKAAQTNPKDFSKDLGLLLQGHQLLGTLMDNSGTTTKVVNQKNKDNFLNQDPDYVGMFKQAIGAVIGTKTYNIKGKQDPIDIPKFINAIGEAETGGVKGDRYGYSRDSGIKEQGDALGKYQTTEGTLKTSFPKYMGYDVDPQTYLSDSNLQDTYMNSMVTHNMNEGLSPQEIAYYHRYGSNATFDPQNPYVQSVMKYYNGK